MSRYQTPFQICRSWLVILYLLLVLLVLMSIEVTIVHASSSPTRNGGGKGMILRIRLADGSMERVQLQPGAEDSMTLRDVLKPFNIQEDSSIIKMGGGATKENDKDNNDNSNKDNSGADDGVVDVQQTLSALGAKHGSIFTIQSPRKSAETETTDINNKPKQSRFAQLKAKKRTWDPFPDLAKDYETALLRTKTRRSSQSGMSYGDISRLQSSLHIVEPQQEGRFKRVYMCAQSAERFHSNGFQKKTKNSKKNPDVQCRVGLLLGTIQKERVDTRPRKARTSLSSQTSDSEYCTVTKVQAIWDPTGQKPVSKALYDTVLASQLLNKNDRVLAIAEKLGLVPVGWIFSHADDRQNDNDDSDTLPVYDLDVYHGATLQIANMQSRGVVDGAKFVTLSMDATSGATEAFQLSDVSVQMVHEGIMVVSPTATTTTKEEKKRGTATKATSQRQISTKHAVLVDSRETKELDSVLCLVNTAMLSHVGSFAGTSATGTTKKNNGALTNRAKKTLLKAMDNDRTLLEELCNFNTILALDQSLSATHSDELCELVRKWARGQKQGTKLGSKLKLRLKAILES